MPGIPDVGISISLGKVAGVLDFLASLDIDFVATIPFEIERGPFYLRLKAVVGTKCPDGGFQANGEVVVNTSKADLDAVEDTPSQEDKAAFYMRVSLAGAKLCADDRHAEWELSGDLQRLSIAGGALELRDVKVHATGRDPERTYPDPAAAPAPAPAPGDEEAPAPEEEAPPAERRRAGRRLATSASSSMALAEVRLTGIE